MTKFAEVKKYSCYRLIRALLVATFMILVVADVAARQFTLVIDAGHGGHDAGAKGSFSYEKKQTATDIANMKICLNMFPPEPDLSLSARSERRTFFNVNSLPFFFAVLL